MTTNVLGHFLHLVSACDLHFPVTQPSLAEPDDPAFCCAGASYLPRLESSKHQPQAAVQKEQRPLQHVGFLKVIGGLGFDVGNRGRHRLSADTRTSEFSCMSTHGVNRRLANILCLCCCLLPLLVRGVVVVLEVHPYLC